jgi:hypothetical protein
VKAIVFEIPIFDAYSSIEASEETLSVLLLALTASNVIYLREHPNTPDVYSAGVRYVREAPGVEKWKGIRRVIEDGYGDCEDLASYRAAWAIVKEGRQGAHVTFSGREISPGFRLYHIFVLYPDGTTEDPSARLGMYSEEEQQWQSY